MRESAPSSGPAPPATCAPGAGARAPAPFSWGADGAQAALLVITSVVAHCGALQDGLFFDDHWHRVTLRTLGWDWHGLIEAATFDVPGELVNLWWQDTPLQWRYARPVAMLAMKAEQRVTSGDPASVHAAAIFWHALCSLCVYGLARYALPTRGWALVAALLFAVHPHAVFCVGWTAARNALVGCLLFAAAMLAWLIANSAHGRTAGWSLVALALALWMAALLARESAIVFPALALTMDLGRGGMRFVRQRWGLHLVLALLAGAYLSWRLLIFPTSDVPDIYFARPEGLGFIPWLAARVLHLLFSLIFHTPMLLGLGENGAPLAPHALLIGLMTACLAVAGLWYRASAGCVAQPLLWPTWLVLAFVPVAPVFFMPHFAYLPAVAWCIMLAAMLSRLPPRSARLACALVLLATLWSHVLYRHAWRGIVRSEQLIYADLLAELPPLQSGDRAYFIDLPVAAIYATIALREASDLAALHGEVLTFAPHPLHMDAQATLTCIDAHTLELRCAAPGYFAGLSGLMLVRGMREDAALPAGLVVQRPHLTATVVEADADGVTRLRLRFAQRLDAPGQHFFRVDPRHGAQRLLFTPQGDEPTAMSWAPAPAGTPLTDDALHARYPHYFPVSRAQMLSERERAFALQRLAARFAPPALFRADPPRTPPE